ncbi:Gfo/Idh/MocA family oxidoreductase [candidate division KSB1 bacterium]|nr:Gfo/Idh/MocA family oxidoreductase [candidate division KSB1 bacterium]
MENITRRRAMQTIGVTAVGLSTFSAKSFARIVGANDRINIGIIGCGGMSNSHRKSFVENKDNDNIDVIAVCDVFTKRMEKFAEKSEAASFPEYKKLLESKDVDAVLIGTPEHWHHRMIIDSLDAGKHVYVEKPMTHKIDEAREVVDKTNKKKKLKVQVGVQGMSDHTYRIANEYIKAGYLGKVLLAQIDYSRHYLDDFWAYKIDEDAKPGINLDWDAWLGPAPKRPWDPDRCFRWRRYWDYSGGIATDLFVHRVTRLIKSIGLDFPKYVSGTGGKFKFTDSLAEIPDTFNMLVDYPDGPTVSLVSTMANGMSIRHAIRGYKATMEFTGDGLKIIPEPDMEGYNKDEATGEVKPLVVHRKLGGEDITLHHRNWFNAIRFDEEIRCPVELGYYAVVVCAMGVESYRRRAYLEWDRKKETWQIAKSDDKYGLK